MTVGSCAGGRTDGREGVDRRQAELDAGRPVGVSVRLTIDH